LKAEIDPDKFWDSTPKEIFALMEAFRWKSQQNYNLAMSTAWHTAALMRQKRMPPLKRLLHSGSSPRRIQSTDEQMRRFSMTAQTFKSK